MKKYAFTLMEVLISLSIIAFLGLILLGVLNDSMSEHSEKIGSLKANNTLKEIVENLLNQSSYYPKHDFGYFGSNRTELQNKDYIKFRESFKKILINPRVADCHIFKGSGLGMNGTVEQEFCLVGTDGIAWGIPNTDFAEINTVKTVQNGRNSYYLPITVYPNFNNAETSEEYLYDNAILYGLRRDGRLIFLDAIIDTAISDIDSRKETLHYRAQKYIQPK